MLARLLAAATTIAVLAAPAAAHAAVDRAPHGPSATPLLVELGVAAVFGLVLLARRPAARAARAALARRAFRQQDRSARLSAPRTTG